MDDSIVTNESNSLPNQLSKSEHNDTVEMITMNAVSPSSAIKTKITLSSTLKEVTTQQKQTKNPNGLSPVKTIHNSATQMTTDNTIADEDVKDNSSLIIDKNINDNIDDNKDNDKITINLIQNELSNHSDSSTIKVDHPNITQTTSPTISSNIPTNPEYINKSGTPEHYILAENTHSEKEEKAGKEKVTKDPLSALVVKDNQTEKMQIHNVNKILNTNNTDATDDHPPQTYASPRTEKVMSPNKNQLGLPTKTNYLVANTTDTIPLTPNTLTTAAESSTKSQFPPDEHFLEPDVADESSTAVGGESSNKKSKGRIATTNNANPTQSSTTTSKPPQKEEKYKRKYTDLKRKVDQVDQDTNSLRKLLDRAKDAIKKLTDQRSFLFQKLETIHGVSIFGRDKFVDPSEFSDFDRAESVLSGKKRRSRGPIDPNAPKRPPNGYMMYCIGERELLMKERDIKKQEGTLNEEEENLRNMTKELGARWRALPPEEKQKHQELARDAMNKYNEDMKVYMDGLKMQPPKVVNGDTVDFSREQSILKDEDSIMSINTDSLLSETNHIDMSSQDDMITVMTPTKLPSNIISLTNPMASTGDELHGAEEHSDMPPPPSTPFGKEPSVMDTQSDMDIQLESAKLDSVDIDMD